MRKKICFVGLDAYPVLNPNMGDYYFGGESVQHTLLAKAFSELGYEVSLLSLDYGQPDKEMIDNITVYKTFAEGDGLPVFRFFYPKLSSIIRALKMADADIYFQSCAGMLTGVVAWFCKKYDKKFIFRLAHDSDCIPGEQIIPNWRDKKIYEYGLKRADFISAQGVKQVKLMYENYGIDSVSVNMTVQLPNKIDDDQRDIDILWVNNIRQFKRPELVAELAKLLPNYNITMIGGAVPGNEEMYKDIEKKAKTLDNLNFLGAVPYQEVNTYFEISKIFINTSDSEGFPNSFLQAWVRGVPVISFFDPDGLIGKEDLGIVPHGINDMAEKISLLMKNKEVRNEMSRKCKFFAEENYSPLAVAKKYEEAIEKGKES